MFAGNATEALALYGSIFREFQIQEMERYGAEAPGKEDWVKMAEVSFHGHVLIVIDSPVQHAFTFTPAMSLFVDCENEAEFEGAFKALAEGGIVYMEPDSYGFSKRFGWCQDRFGVSWQVNVP
jgi:predicted 3-demethylubiquinone-9 3-methyltransferase (glyoxalase superfamily)